MPRHCLLLYVLLLIWPSDVVAQPTTASGEVWDAQSKIPLPGCLVILLPSGSRAVTGEDGKFLIRGEGSHLVFSSMGYTADTIKLQGVVDRYVVYLEPSVGTLREVTVTGQRGNSTFTMDPTSRITLATAAFEIPRSGNILDNIAANVPGMDVVKTGPNISKPFIRGLGYFRVLTLYDGLRQEGQQWGDEHGIEVDPYHVSSVEVIRGPASLLYGSDALAGVVSFHPAVERVRDGKWRGKWIQEYQSNHHQLGQALRMGAGWGKWMVNVQSSWRQAGNYTNRVDGRVYNTGFSDRNAAIRLSHFSFTGSTEVNFTVFDDLQAIPDGSRDSLTRKFTTQVNEFPLDNVKHRPIVSPSDLNGYQMSPLHQHIRHVRAYGRYRYALGKGDMEGMFGWQQNGRTEFNHPTASGQPGLDVRLSTWNFETKYYFPEWHALQLVTGIQAMHQQNRNINGTDFPIPDYDLREAGVFGMGQWKMKWLSLQGGLRMDYRYTSAPDFFVKPRQGSGWMEQVTDTSGAELQYKHFQRLYRGVSWSLGATMVLSEHWTLRSNWSRGYRAPQMVEVLSAGLDPGAHILYLGNRGFVPEFNIQEDVELDWHASWLHTSVSLFNNDVAHYIYLARAVDAQGIPLIIDGGNRVFRYRQDKAQLYGAEFSTDLHPTQLRGMSLRSDFSVTYGFNRASAFAGKGVQGEYLPFIPPLKWMGNLHIPISFKSKRWTDVSFQWGWEWHAPQNRFMALDASETRTAGYTLWHPGIGFSLQLSGFRLTGSIRIDNAFDRTYQSHLSRLKYFEYFNRSSNGYTGIQSMGRSFNFKMTVIF